MAPTGCSKARVVAPVGARTARSRRSSRSRRDGAVADWTYLIATLKALALPPVEYHVTESVLLPILNLCGIFTVELIFVPVFALLVKRVRCKNDSGTLSKLRGAKRRCVAIMRGAHEERSDEEYTRSGATRSTRGAERRGAHEERSDDYYCCRGASPLWHLVSLLVAPLLMGSSA